MASQHGSNQGPGTGIDSETAARRRARLERRVANLEHDIAQAAGAGHADSHWRRRVDEVGNAIEQAGADADLLASSTDRSPPIELPGTAVSGIDVQVDIPATVRFTIGAEAFRYSEEIDWTERGEQRAIPGLRRFEGDPEALIPDDAPPERREALGEHLAHALGALAIALRDESSSLPDELTLADLASPCPVCGSWRDHRDRCISCQRREWRANAVRSEIGRMMEERNDLLEEIANQREALPILQRQLQDARRELEKYIDAE